ncbi:hypothetical protein GOBAR_DD26223 [Gossypium barbadense]|nr:hypothetical protein GOBAR_DD26223 [Gossypium barbadense]
MDMVLAEENDPLLSMEGKKRQRVVGDTIISSGNNIEGGLHDIIASSAGIGLLGFNTVENSLLSFEDGEGSEEFPWLVFKALSFYRFGYTE